MSKEGFIGEDGQFYQWPKPLLKRNASAEEFQAWVDHAYRVADNPDVYGERQAAYQRHLIHGPYSEMAQERSFRGRRKKK